MTTEQLGTGNTADANTIAGDLIVGGSIAMNGTTVAPSKPTIATLPVTATTGDLEDIGIAINAILSALEDLGLATLS